VAQALRVGAGWVALGEAMSDSGSDKPREPSRVLERVRQVGRGVEGALEGAARSVHTGVGSVKQGVERVSERVSGGPRIVQLTGTSGHDLLLDIDGRRSGEFICLRQPCASHCWCDIVCQMSRCRFQSTCVSDIMKKATLKHFTSSCAPPPTHSPGTSCSSVPCLWPHASTLAHRTCFPTNASRVRASLVRVTRALAERAQFSCWPPQRTARWCSRQTERHCER
jgi:hypothetical protein